MHSDNTNRKILSYLSPTPSYYCFRHCHCHCLVAASMTIAPTEKEPYKWKKKQERNRDKKIILKNYFRNIFCMFRNVFDVRCSKKKSKNHFVFQKVCSLNFFFPEYISCIFEILFQKIFRTYNLKITSMNGKILIL